MIDEHLADRVRFGRGVAVGQDAATLEVSAEAAHFVFPHRLATQSDDAHAWKDLIGQRFQKQPEDRRHGVEHGDAGVIQPLREFSQAASADVIERQRGPGEQCSVDFANACTDRE